MLYSASCHHWHPDDASMRNPPKPSEDPGDVTGDDERHPDAPTEPPDLPEGMRRQWRQEQVEMRVSRVLGASRGSAQGTGDDGIETHRVMKFGEAQVESRDPTGVQIEPGGEISVERDGSTAHEDADTTVDGRAEEGHGVVQVEGERGGTRRNVPVEGEREHAPADAQSMVVDEKRGQPTLQDDEHIPRAPQEPPPPVHTPDKPTER